MPVRSPLRRKRANLIASSASVFARPSFGTRDGATTRALKTRGLQFALKTEPGGTRFVGDLQYTARSEIPERPDELIEIVRYAPQDRRRGAIRISDGDRDALLVDVKTDKT